MGETARWPSSEVVLHDVMRIQIDRLRGELDELRSDYEALFKERKVIQSMIQDAGAGSSDAAQLAVEFAQAHDALGSLQEERTHLLRQLLEQQRAQGDASAMCGAVGDGGGGGEWGCWQWDWEAWVSLSGTMPGDRQVHPTPGAGTAAAEGVDRTRSQRVLRLAAHQRLKTAWELFLPPSRRRPVRQPRSSENRSRFGGFKFSKVLSIVTL